MAPTHSHKIPALIVLLSLLIAAVSIGHTYAQSDNDRKYYTLSEEIINGDTVQVVNLVPVYVFARAADLRRYERLIRNIKIVYPIAKAAKRRLDKAEAALLKLDTNREQKEYIAQMEEELKRIYTPIIQELTFSQGKVLIKLIDRETSSTSYQIVQDLRGSFSAFFWQGVARVFGANLKAKYDKEGEDRLIERIILQYEAGLL